MPIDRPELEYCNELGVRDGSSPALTFHPDGASTIRKFFIPWESRYDAVKAYLGCSEIERATLTGPPVRLMRLPPYRHPDLALQYVRSARVSGHKWVGIADDPDDDELTGEAKGNVFEKGVFEVTYEVVDAPQLTDEECPADKETYRNFFLDEWSPAVEYLALPSGLMKFLRSGGGDPNTRIVPYPAGIVLPTISMIWRWCDLPADLLKPGDPWIRRLTGDPAATPSAYRSFIGTVNKTAWPDLGSGTGVFPAGTLLLDSIRPIRKRSALGTQTFDVQLCTLFKPTGHNKLYYNDNTSTGGTNSGFYYVGRGSAPTYYAPGAVPDDRSLYCERDFALLTQVQADPS